MSKSFTYKLFVFFLVISAAYFTYARINKVTKSGLQVDEAFHVRFADDLQTALDRYPNLVFKAPEFRDRYLGTANHNTNYVAIYYTRLFLSKFGIPINVWYQRIPILVASLIFVLGLALLIPKLFHSKALGLFAFLFFASNYAIFDLMIIARGYGYQVASFIVVLWTWIGFRNLLKFTMRTNIFKYLTCFTLLVLSNSLAISFSIGALLTSIVPFLILNHLFALYLVYESRLEKLKYVPIVVFTFSTNLLVFFFCRYIYYYKFEALLNIAKSVPTHEHSKIFLDEITSFYFIDPLKVMNSSSNYALNLYLVSLITWLVIFLRERKKSDSLRSIPVNPERAFLRRVILFTSLFLPFVLSTAIDFLDRSVGEARHQPVMAILFALGIFLSLDRIILHAGRINMKFKQILVPVLCTVVGCYTYFLRFDPLVNKAYPGWDMQSATGVLLNKLQDIDPNKYWVIHVGGIRTHWNQLIINYYRSFGYKAHAVLRDEEPHDFQMCSTFDSKDICHPEYPRFEDDFFRQFQLTIADKRKL